MFRSSLPALRPLIRVLLVLVLFPFGLLAQGLALSTESEEAGEAFLEGLHWRQNGDRAQARAAFKRALELDPDFVVARVMDLHADVSISPRERYHRMGESIDELAEGTTSELLLVLAYRQWLSGNVDGDWEAANRSANRLFDALRAIAPDSPEAAYAYANSRVAWVFGPDENVAALREVADRFPDYPPPRNLLAYRLAETGDLAGAREQVAAFLELAPESPNAHDSYAEIMQWSGLLGESQKHYEQAVALGRNASRISIASVQQILGDGNAARQTLRARLAEAETARDTLPVLRALAYSHLRDGQVQEGTARLIEVTTLGRASGYDGWAAHAFRELALFDAMMGDGRQVDAYLEQASKLERAEYNTWFAACAYAASGRRAEAREAARAHAEAFPEAHNATWHHTLDALLSLYEGDAQSATQSLMRSNLANPWATALMALAKRQTGELADAAVMEREVRDSRRVFLPNSDQNVPVLLLDHMHLVGGSQ